MSYQVLARKWRPQRFDDVLGQQAVTRTLKNALKTGRIAHAFVFAGPRGCGKTTTARILARALNCAIGPTPEPCGMCEACIEIAEGRDIDVLEIDAATHTGVDNVREVIIEGLSIAPVRNRYKIFLIDEVHQLSTSSFNALLKSIEEPPPHVVFMMATTELQKIPDTVASRSQIYEFRTISPKTVADRLRFIADEEKIDISDAAVQLLARAGEGSMRDSLSALDQVRAFAGDTITVDDVVTVLGLVGRDLVFDMLESVADENAPAAFALVERAIERGYDLRLLCRELARATRDLLVLSVDPNRVNDADVAADAERDRLTALGQRFSREDLLRAFDLLTKTEQEIRTADQPRFNMEMALLRLMHLRKLVPIEQLISSATGAPGAPATGSVRATGAVRSGGTPPLNPPLASRSASAPVDRTSAPVNRTAPGPPDAPIAPDLKTTFLAAVKSGKAFLYNTVVAQAYSVDVTPSRITFAFLPNQKVPKLQCEESRPALEAIAEKVSGSRIPVVVKVIEAPTDTASAPAAVTSSGSASPSLRAPVSSDAALRDEAMTHPAVQALFEIFPVEKTKIEEM